MTHGPTARAIPSAPRRYPRHHRKTRPWRLPWRPGRGPSARVQAQHPQPTAPRLTHGTGHERASLFTHAHGHARHRTIEGTTRIYRRAHPQSRVHAWPCARPPVRTPPRAWRAPSRRCARPGRGCRRQARTPGGRGTGVRRTGPHTATRTRQQAHAATCQSRAHTSYLTSTMCCPSTHASSTIAPTSQSTSAA